MNSSDYNSFPEEPVDLTPKTIKGVEKGVASAKDSAVRQTTSEILHRLEAMAEGHPETRVHATIRRCVVRSLIHALFRVQVENQDKIPKQPAIIAANHLHHLDPLLLLGELPTYPHYYVLGDARTLYNKFWKRWLLRLVGGVIPLERTWREEVAVIEAAKAGRQDLLELATAIENNVPTGKDIQTLRQIDRIVLGILSQGDGLVLFPEGRLGSVEGQLHPLKRGTVTYALRAGVPIVPVALIGTHHLYLGKKLTVRFGEPLYFSPTSRIKRQEVDAAVEKLQNAMINLLPDNYQEPQCEKVLSNFLNYR